MNLPPCRLIQFRTPTPIFGIGTAIVSLGIAFNKLAPFGEGGILSISKSIIFFILIFVGVTTVISSFTVFRVVSYYRTWNIKRITQDISNWKPSEDEGNKSHCLSILQTFCPEKSTFSAIENKLINSTNEIFSLRFLLVDPESEVLKSRMDCRGERLKYAQLGVSDTVNLIQRLKVNVEEYWKKIGHERELEVQVRYYSACPFGPIFILGKHALWTGFYISHDSSDAAPMLRILNSTSVDWLTLEESFEQIWNSSTTKKFDL